MSLRKRIEELFERGPQQAYGEEYTAAFFELKIELNAGRVRAAEKVGERWHANSWVKKGIPPRLSHRRSAGHVD